MVESIGVESVTVEAIMVESIGVESVTIKAIMVESIGVESVTVEAICVKTVNYILRIKMDIVYGHGGALNAAAEINTIAGCFKFKELVRPITLYKLARPICFVELIGAAVAGRPGQLYELVGW